MRALLGLVISVFSVAASAQAGSYLCVADQAAGFKFNKTTETWERTNFDVSSLRFVVARSKNKNYKWSVTRIGDNRPLTSCTDDIGEGDVFLTCNVFDPTFFLYVPTLRFTISKLMGYIVPVGTEEGDVAPYLAIGKCSPI